MNHGFIIGRLTADPAQRDANGVTCTTFTVAADTRRKDKDGEKITNFWRVTAWRGLGDTAAKYLHKGDRVSIVGNDISLNTYTDKNGQWRASLELTATDMEFLSSKSESAGGTQETQQNPSSKAMPAESDDDLPF